MGSRDLGAVDPPLQEPLAQKVADLWPDLAGITGPEVLTYARSTNPRLRPLASYADADVLAAIHAPRQVSPAADEDGVDLLQPEWQVLADPSQARAESGRRARPARRVRPPAPRLRTSRHGRRSLAGG